MKQRRQWLTRLPANTILLWLNVQYRLIARNDLLTHLGAHIKHWRYGIRAKRRQPQNDLWSVCVCVPARLLISVAHIAHDLSIYFCNAVVVVFAMCRVFLDHMQQLQLATTTLQKALNTNIKCTEHLRKVFVYIFCTYACVLFIRLSPHRLIHQMFSLYFLFALTRQRTRKYARTWMSVASPSASLRV